MEQKSLVVHICLFSFWWISEFSVIIKLKERTLKKEADLLDYTYGRIIQCLLI